MTKPNQQPPINIDLPVGTKLGWELENTVESDSLHPIADRYTHHFVFFSLRIDSFFQRCSSPLAQTVA